MSNKRMVTFAIFEDGKTEPITINEIWENKAADHLQRSLRDWTSGIGSRGRPTDPWDVVGKITGRIVGIRLQKTYVDGPRAGTERLVTMVVLPDLAGYFQFIRARDKRIATDGWKKPTNGVPNVLPD